MDAKKQILDSVDRYVYSVNALDFAAVRNLWVDSPDISFIHPKGYEIGMEAIISRFYLETMGQFVKRELKPKEIAVTLYTNCAVAAFCWDFHAVRADDGRAVETHGTESQIYIFSSDNAWKLAHIHYSLLPAIT